MKDLLSTLFLEEFLIKYSIRQGTYRQRTRLARACDCLKPLKVLEYLR